MRRSFTETSPEKLMKKILITGAAGQIGRALRKAWQGKYRMRLTDIAALDPPGAGKL